MGIDSQLREAHAAQEARLTAGESCWWGRKEEWQKYPVLFAGYVVARKKKKKRGYTRSAIRPSFCIYALSGLCHLSGFSTFSGCCSTSGLHMLRSALWLPPERLHRGLAEKRRRMAIEPSSRDRKHTIRGCVKPMLRKLAVASASRRPVVGSTEVIMR